MELFYATIFTEDFNYNTDFSYYQAFIIHHHYTHSLVQINMYWSMFLFTFYISTYPPLKQKKKCDKQSFTKKSNCIVGLLYPNLFISSHPTQ